MSAWIVYSKDGTTERCRLKKLEYSGSFMNERTVTATFECESEVAFDVFDYIEYRGEKFELEAIPSVKKTSSHNYEYELRFVSLKYELERCEMRDIVPNDNGIVYPTPLTFSFTGDVAYLAERIQANLDALYGKGVWSIVVAEGVTSEDKNITISQQNCWNALSLVNTTYELDFTVKGRVVTIGGNKPSISHIFQYGKGKGLYEIERSADTETGIVTKLRAYGGTKNLDYSYPKKPEWSDSILDTSFVLSPLRLMLPSFKKDGKTDYIMADDSLVAKYGIREASVIYEDIYPSITSATNCKGEAIDEIKAVDDIDDSKSTFVIHLHELGFDLEDNLTTANAQVSMKTGAMQGYTFNIADNGIERLDDGSYKLTLGRITASSSDTDNFDIPNSKWNMKAGDKFVFLNILMPQEYIRSAENRLLERAKEYLSEYAKTNFSYNVGLHDKFLKQNQSVYNELIEGSKLRVYDEELGISEDVTIQSISITENMEDNILPQVKITLNNKPSASTLDRIQGQIKELSETTSGTFSSQSELLKQYRKKLDKPFFDRLFVAVGLDGKELASTDTNSPIAYIKAKYSFATIGGITMYAQDGNVDIPTIAEGLPFDNRTIWFNPTTGQIEVIGGTGGGSGEGGVSSFWELNGIPTWITIDKPKYSYSEIVGTPDLSVYATEEWVLGKNYALSSDLTALNSKLTDFLEGSDTDSIINKWKELEAFLIGLSESDNLATILGTKADKATTLGGYGITDAYTKTDVNSLLKGYVTITGTEDITGIHSFVNGLKIGGIELRKSKDGVVYIDGNLVVKGGVTMYGDENADIPSIYDGLPIDNVTIYWENTSNGKVLKAKVGTEGAITEITSAMVIAALGFTPYDSSNPNGYITSSALNGYATQAWVKNQGYLTQHQDLSGYQPLISSSNKLAYSLISGTPTSLKNPNALSFGSKSYDGSAKITLTASDLGALTSHQSIYTLTFQPGQFTSGSFSANSANKTINIPTTTSHISEGSNLYFTNTRAVSALADTLKAYVTLAGTQTITGEKNFTGGLKVNGSPLVYNKESGYWKLEGDLIVTGGVSMFASDTKFTPSTIMDAIAVDGVTIIKQDGKLVALGGGGTGGGGIADSVAWGNVLGKPSWITDDAPIIGISGVNVSLGSGISQSSLRTALGLGSLAYKSSLGKADVGLGNVENTALSTWVGTSKITTLGTITTGTWNGTKIANAYLANSAITISGTSVSLGGSITQSALRTALGLGSNAYTSTSYLPLSGGTLTNMLTIASSSHTKTLKIANTDYTQASAILFMGNSGDFVIRSTYASDDSISDLRFNKNTLKVNGKTVYHSGNFTPSDYLPLTGGALTGNLSLQYANPRLILKDADGTTLGAFGLNNDVLSYYKTADTKWYTIYHSGNFTPSNYLPLTGGTLSGKLILDNNIALCGKATDGTAMSVLQTTTNNNLSIGLDTSAKGYSTYISGFNIYLRYGTSRTTGLILNSSGNITIGSSDSAADEYKLYIGGRTYINGAVYTNNSIIKVNSGNDYRLVITHSGEEARIYNYLADDSGYGNIRIGNKGSNCIFFDGVNSRLGIKTTSPGYTLDVNGVINTNNNVYAQTTSNVIRQVKVANDVGSTALYVTTSGNRGLYDLNDNSWIIYTDGTNTLSSTKTHIQKSNVIYHNNKMLYWYQSDNATSMLTLYVNASNALVLGKGTAQAGGATYLDGNVIYFRYGKSNTTGMYLNSSGNVGIGTSSPSQKLHVAGNILVTGGTTMYSARKLKNITDERGLSLDELSTIKPTRFTWKDGRDNKIHIGGIADDVQRVLPEVIYKTDDDVLTMDYGNAAFAIAASLIKPVINHEERIRLLEEENKRLKEEVEQLKWNIA